MQISFNKLFFFVNAVFSIRELSILFSRVAIFILSYSIIAVYNEILYETILDKGLGVYNSLFHSSPEVCAMIHFNILCGVFPTIGKVCYSNADADKVSIIKKNKGKAGIYRWVNTENGKCYVGSSINLGLRLGNYFSVYYLLRSKSKNMLIVKALLKYGYSKFSLEILEYCEPKVSLLIEREQYYIDSLNPKYNILKIARSSFGFRHSDEVLAKLKGRKLLYSTILLMKERAIGRHIGRKHTEDTLEKMSNSKQGKNNPMFGAKHLEETKAKISAVNGVSIKVYDKETNTTSYYTSMRKAAEAIGVGNSTLTYQFKKSSCVYLKKERYCIEKVLID